MSSKRLSLTLSAMEFASLLRQERQRRRLQQRTLAALVGCSPTLVSRIERGHELPSPDLAYKIATVLGLSAKVQKDLFNSLEADRQTLTRGPKSVFRFGKEFSDLLGEVGLSVSGFAAEIGRPSLTVRRWLEGSRLPGAETVADEILPALRAAGGSRERLHRLKTSHLLDLLTKASTVPYLTGSEQRDIIQLLTSALLDDR